MYKALEVIICFFFSVQFRLCEPFCWFHSSFLSLLSIWLSCFLLLLLLYFIFLRSYSWYIQLLCRSTQYTHEHTQFTCLLFSVYTHFWALNIIRWSFSLARLYLVYFVFAIPHVRSLSQPSTALLLLLLHSYIVIIYLIFLLCFNIRSHVKFQCTNCLSTSSKIY